MSSKQIKEIINQLTTISPPPQHIAIISSDCIRRQRTLSKIAEGLKLHAEGKWIFDVKRIKLSQAKDQELKAFIFESNAQSFFSKKQIFLIEDLEKVTATQTDILLKLFEQSQSDNYYFFLGTGLLKSSRLMKHFEKNASVVKLDDFEIQEFKIWIKQEFDSREIIPDASVIEFLAQSSNLSADIVTAKIEQLELVTDDQKITLKMAQDLFPNEIPLEDFALLNAINAGNKLLAQKLLTKALAEGQAPLSISASIQSNYLNFYLIASLRERGYSQEQIKSAIKMHPYAFKLQYPIASQKSLKGLIKDLKALVLADTKLKNVSLGNEAVFFELINSLS